MHIRDLAGKKICILGYGREGQAMAEALEKYAPCCKITIADRDEKIQIPTTKFQVRFGSSYLDALESFDVIIKSPGIPPNKLITDHRSLTTPTQIFFDTIADSGALIIGVTGSKGKSTTASLIHAILKANSQLLKAKSFLIGNIGDPAIAHLEDARSNTIFVHELSSYQLMDQKSSPPIAVITSFFPEHLDYHSTRPELCRTGSLMASPSSNTPLENYLEAKKRITRFQTENDIVFFAERSKEAEQIARAGKGRKISFSAKDSPVTLKEIQLKGEHNLSNIAAAFKVAVHLGVDPESAIEVIKLFKGLPHRLQSLGVHDGIEWVDDSISTTPESAIAALDALGDRVQTIILGGQDRGYDFAPLAKRLAASNVKTVILMPDSGETILAALQQRPSVAAACIEAKTMEEAIRAAKSSIIVGTGDSRVPTTPIVLLSPASPSYGHFKNFEDRSDQFKASAVTAHYS